MLAKRIIPVLLTRDGNLVKGERFDSRRVVGIAQQAAEIHQSRGVDELIVLDVGATPAKRGPDIEAMRRLTECCFIPAAVGGGVTTVDQVRELLANGADKVVIGRAAADNPRLIRECADRFGSQAITVAHNYVRHGRIIATCQHYERMGAGEILLNAAYRDGMMNGYDLPALRAVSRYLGIPVIAACGAGKYLHMHNALKAGASAVAAGAMFQWTDQTPRGAAEYLAEKGWEVRL